MIAKFAYLSIDMGMIRLIVLELLLRASKPDSFHVFCGKSKKLAKICDEGGIRTHVSEETGALNQRLRPLGHATLS